MIKAAGKHRHWLKAKVWAAAAIFVLLSGGAWNVAKESSDNPAQLPPALRAWNRVESLEGASPALKSFKLAVEAYLGARYDSALSLLPSDQDAKATAVADYILLYRSKIHLMAESDKEALEGFSLFEKQFPESPLLPDALMGQCQALLKLGDAQAALSVLNHPRFRKDSGSLYYRARALELSGEKEEAVRLYLRYYAEYPKAGYAALAQRNLLALAPSALQGKRSFTVRVQRAESLLKENDASGARQILLALGRVAAPDTASTQKRNLLLGEVEYKLGRTATALTHLLKVTAAEEAMHAKALRLEASCYRRSRKEQDLITLRDKALKLYPSSPETEEICYSVATYFDVNCESEKAWQAYKILHENFPKGSRAERASWKLALFHYLKKEYREAASGFWRHLQTHADPSAAPAAMYWMGRSYERLGGSENARYLYRRVQSMENHSYYGLHAREAEASLAKSGVAGTVSIPGIAFEKVTALCDGLQLRPADLPAPGSAVVTSLERARQLWLADLPDMAISELQWASRRSPQDKRSIAYAMAQIYAGNNGHYRAISALRSVFPDYVNRQVPQLPAEIWQLLFPMDHWDLVSAQADKNQLDPALVMGLIRQESAFNENARSSANARGLMQILPSTGSRLARQAGIRRYTSAKLFQAETNIILGTRYLASLMNRYGSIELALAAYNAGGTRVDAWLKELGDVDMPEFVENIPFSETRGYIRQVLSNRALYGLLNASAATETP